MTSLITVSTDKDKTIKISGDQIIIVFNFYAAQVSSNFICMEISQTPHLPMLSLLQLTIKINIKTKDLRQLNQIIWLPNIHIVYNILIINNNNKLKLICHTNNSRF